VSSDEVSLFDVSFLLGSSSFNELSGSLFSNGEDNVVLVTKNKEGSFKIQGDISKLKKGFKVKVTGHVKGIGDDATMEDNTPQQLAIDLKSFLPEGEQPRKVSTIGETVGGFCDDVVCAYFINHYAAIFFVGCLIVWLSDDKITEKSSKASASFNASKQSQKSPTTISQQTNFFSLLMSPCILNEPSLFFVTSTTLSSPYVKNTRKKRPTKFIKARRVQ
jgi:hypothetical protein